MILGIFFMCFGLHNRNEFIWRCLDPDNPPNAFHFADVNILRLSGSIWRLLWSTFWKAPKSVPNFYFSFVPNFYFSFDVVPASSSSLSFASSHMHVLWFFLLFFSPPFLTSLTYYVSNSPHLSFIQFSSSSFFVFLFLSQLLVFFLFIFFIFFFACFCLFCSALFFFFFK